MNNTAPHNPIVNPTGKLPVGVSDFAKLRQEDYCFVDKTLFIQEFLDVGGEVTLITRPRRFGKTVNLDMLCRFLREPAREQGDLFDGLAISKQQTQYQQERGKRPLLFLSFRTIKESNWKDAYTRMSGLLSDIAQEVSQEAPVDCLTNNQQDILHKVIHKQADSAECKSILVILIKLLTHQHKGLTPWVAIDEYDAPMQAAYQHNYYKEMRDLMKGLLGDCLKDGRFLHRAVLTGILRVAKEDIFSELNNPGIYGVLDHPYSSWFGFTEHEVKQLLQQRGHSERFEAVRQAYNGYRFGQDQPLMIYNPWSVINDLRKPTAQPGLHWVNTSDNYLIHQLLTRANTDTKRGLHELLSASSHYSTTQTLKEYVPLRFLENDSAHLWGLLLASGYVTAVAHQKKTGSLEHVVQLRIPNQEVSCVYNDLLQRWLTSGTGASGTTLLDALVAGQVQEFASYFKQFALESIGYFDKSNTQPERFYHGFVLGMVHYLQDRYVVDSQRESGLGRYDLALEPKDKTLPGFVMEFKTCLGDTTSLNNTAQQALQQIQDKQYHIELAKRGVQPIIALGFAFSGKQVAIAHKTLTEASVTQQ